MSTMYWILTGVSLFFTKLNIESARSTILLKGYKIDDYKLDLYGKINAFLRDYLFAFVPIYHIYKTFYVDRYLTPHDVYVQNRMKFYDDLGILREADEKELRKKEAKEAKLKKVNDMAEEQYEQAHEEVSNMLIEKITGRTPEEIFGEQKIEEPVQLEPEEPAIDTSTLEGKKLDLEKRQRDLIARKKAYIKVEEEMILPYEDRLEMYNEIMSDEKEINALEQVIRNLEESQDVDLSDVLSKKEEGQVLSLK